MLLCIAVSIIQFIVFSYSSVPPPLVSLILQTNDLTIGWQNSNPQSHTNTTLASQARQARASGENLNYMTLALQARPSGKVLNYLLSC